MFKKFKLCLILLAFQGPVFAGENGVFLGIGVLNKTYNQFTVQDNAQETWALDSSPDTPLRMTGGGFHAGLDWNGLILGWEWYDNLEQQHHTILESTQDAERPAPSYFYVTEDYAGPYLGLYIDVGEQWKIGAGYGWGTSLIDLHMSPMQEALFANGVSHQEAQSRRWEGFVKYQPKGYSMYYQMSVGYQEAKLESSAISGGQISGSFLSANLGWMLF